MASQARRGPGGAAAAPQKGGQVIVGLSQEPTVFNPLKPHIEVDRGVHMCLFDALWRMNPQGQFVPNLAAAIPTVENGGISKDGLQYTIHLRRGVTWHDGAPFTAADVEFTYQLIMNPKFDAATRVGYDGIASLTTPDPATVVLKLSKPYAPMLALWSDTYIVPKHVLGSVTDLNNNVFDTKPIGTGAFTFGERVAGDHITLEANRKFYGAGPYLDRVIFKYVPDLTVMFTRFQTGDIDVTGIQGITVDHFEEAKRLKGVTLHTGPTNFVEYLWFNLGRPQFQDKAVREALYLGMDKQSYIQRIYYGVPPVSESYLAPSSWAFNPDLPKHEYNPDKAKARLEEAGWKVGGDGIRAKNGVRLSFSNSTTAGNKVREQAQAFLQQNWKAIGVDMQIKDMPAAVVWGDYFFKSQFDSVTVGWNIWGEAGGDPNVLNWFGSGYIPVKSGKGSNTTQYVNEKMDRLAEEGVSVVGQEKRKPIYRQIQAILREDLARISHELGLDQPLPVQYARWAANLVHGDWGRSYRDSRPVLVDIADRLPGTVELMLASLLLAIGIGVAVGILGALRCYSIFDYPATTGAMVSLSIPTFWFGLMMIFVFSVTLGWIPSGDMYSLGRPFSLVDRLHHLVGPVTVLGLVLVAPWSRYTRSGMLEVLYQDYVRTARAKGVPAPRVVVQHALRNALIPLLTLAGVQLPMLFGGALVTETVFSWPGMGRFFVDSLGYRDYPVLMGILIFTAVLVILGNLLADLLYAVVDPRIRFG